MCTTSLCHIQNLSHFNITHNHIKTSYTVAIICGLFFGMNRQSKAKHYASCLIYHYPLERPTKLSGSASISVTPSGKTGVDMSTPVHCVFVCWSHWCTVQKKPNRSRCSLGADSIGLKEAYIRWESRSFKGRGNFAGCLAHWKALGDWESMLCILSDSDNSVLNNGTTCDSAFHQNSLTGCFLTFCIFEGRLSRGFSGILARVRVR